MTDEGIWVLKVFIKILLVACAGIMIFRIWYWADRCVFNTMTVYPPVYQCAVHPFNFTDNYIDMREHNQEMSEWVKAGAKIDDFPPYRQNRLVSESNVDGPKED